MIYINHNFNKMIITKIVCGKSHVFFMTNFGVFRAGDNSLGQISGGDAMRFNRPRLISLPSKIVKVSCGDAHTMAQCEDNSIYCCGDNRLGQLAVGHKIQEIRQFKKVRTIPQNITVEITCVGNTSWICIDNKVYRAGDS
jgi:alpha-tubulin suppressor-like RCC1 family protein